MRRELIATATFGLEAVVRREVEALGYNVIRTEDGKVTYEADERGIVRSNLWLRCADRVLLKIDEFKAREFEELFQRTKGISWEEMIPRDGRFTVTCTSVKSVLHNPPACQRTVKKAIALRLQDFYCLDEMPETGAEYKVKITLLKDRVTLTIDTSGEGLHRRGYRVKDVQAPIKETLAAALVQLSFFRKGRIMIDPCCGGGTIPIEAAMIAIGMAPGAGRTFASESWEMIDPDIWKEERLRAEENIRGHEDDGEAAVRTGIIASDVDPRAIEAARLNADAAGVDDLIRFKQISIEDLKVSGSFEDLRKNDGIVMITNLPYGERIGDREAILSIYRVLKEIMDKNPTWSLFAITSDRSAEKAIGRKADRRRKLYNGNIETTYYQFHGARPERS